MNNKCYICPDCNGLIHRLLIGCVYKDVCSVCGRQYYGGEPYISGFKTVYSDKTEVEDEKL